MAWLEAQLLLQLLQPVRRLPGIDQKSEINIDTLLLGNYSPHSHLPVALIMFFIAKENPRSWVTFSLHTLLIWNSCSVCVFHDSDIFEDYRLLVL